ncbi:MAG: PKD domain-containing protein [Bacteroidota bacterium]
MRLKILLLLLFTIALSAKINAQETSERDIKLSGDYFYGEGVSDSQHTAKSSARDDLVSKISVTVKSKTELYQEENDFGLQSDYNKSSKIFSILKLKGLQYLEKFRNGKYQVIAYLSKEDYNRTMKEIADDVRDILTIAENMERDDGAASAISFFYKAYLKTILSPNPINFKSQLSNSEYNNVKTFLETKIQTFQKKIDYKINALKVDPAAQDLITIDLQADFRYKPVENIEVRLNLPGNPAMQIKSGKASLFLYEQPSELLKDFEIISQIYFNENSELMELHKEFPVEVRQTVQIDFTPIVKIDFTVKKNEQGMLEFIHKVNNLSVSRLEWEMGDNTFSNDQKVLHQYRKDGLYEVTLTVNGLKELKVKKQIDQDGVIHGEKASYLLSTEVKKYSNEITDWLIKAKGYQNVLKYLSDLKTTGKIVVGRKDNFINPEICYVVLFNKESDMVESVISPQVENYRIDLSLSERLEDYRKKYIGKTEIWLTIN